jgi:hypothetical protein
VLRERGCGAVAPYSISESKRERGREREMPRGEKLREAPYKDKAHANFIRKKPSIFFIFVLMVKPMHTYV